VGNPPVHPLFLPSLASARQRNSLRIEAPGELAILRPEFVTTTAIHPNVIAGETPTLSPFAPASPDDLGKQHELGQFLTPNPVAEFMASLFEIPRSEMLGLTR